MRITCDRCGKDRMISETHANAAQRDMPIRDLIARMRHDGCGGLAGKAELLTGIDGRQQPAGAEDRAASRVTCRRTRRIHFARKCLIIQFRNPDRRQTAFALFDRFIGYTRAWHVWQSQTVRSSG
jgi:hypothetical protein